MKILVLSPHVPAPAAGASTRNYYLLKALASQHDVTLLTLNESVVEGVTLKHTDIEHLVKCFQLIERTSSGSKRRGQMLAALQGRSYLLSRSILPEMQTAIDQACRREKFAVVFCESIMLSGYRLPDDTRLVIDEHNLEYELCWRTYRRASPGPRKLYSWLEARRLQPEELKRCSAANLVLVTSERERLELQRLAPSSSVALVPNGVNTAFFYPPDRANEIEYSLIYTGSMDYYPNIDAVLHFASQGWPLVKEQIPHATWMIVGKNPPSQIQQLARLHGVSVTGSVADVRPYLMQAAVAIAPVLIGSGTRLKILEAFAMGKAVVSTSLGCEGLHITAGRELLIADDPARFAADIVKLLLDRSTRETLGSAGRKLVEAEYSWEECGRQLLCALDTFQE